MAASFGRPVPGEEKALDAGFEKMVILHSVESFAELSAILGQFDALADEVVSAGLFNQ